MTIKNNNESTNVDTALKAKALRWSKEFQCDRELMLTAMQYYPNRTKPTWQKLIYDGRTNGLMPNQTLEQIIINGRTIGLTKRRR